MRLTIRSSLLQALVFASTLGVVSDSLAQAAAYPSKAIKMVVPFAPGGPVDYLARATGQTLLEQWGQPVVVENRPGAGGTIGLEAVARSAADGYTLALAGSSNLAVAPNLYAKLPYDPLRDLAPVVNVAATSYVLSVNPGVPAKSIRELIELARAKKGTLSYGSAGLGSMSNLAGELLKALAGVDILHVPYKGAAPYVTAVLAGQIDMIFPDLATAEPLAKAGKLRPLAVTGSKRSTIAQELPTIAEAGIDGYAVDIWFGIVAPAATPKDIVAKLNAAIAGVLKAGELRQRLADRGYEAIGDAPEQFAATIKADIEKFGRIIRRAGIKAEL
ncbi:MAG: tripartite tricarboxylate transporter substrate binding protein [Betaproteobacteria bacterium]|nr:tripartite tricarboxylate transporter substrate binding protein [Betaproteobacteria bacterium]